MFPEEQEENTNQLLSDLYQAICDTIIQSQDVRSTIKSLQKLKLLGLLGPTTVTMDVENLVALLNGHITDPVQEGFPPWLESFLHAAKMAIIKSSDVRTVVKKIQKIDSLDPIHFYKMDLNINQIRHC